MTISDTALRAALRLYPAGYRRDRGEELAAVFADSTAGAGRAGALREAYDLGAYGLRLRTGLTSAGLPGRALAMAAPFAVGAAAGHAGLVLVITAFDGLPDPRAGGGTWLLLALLSMLPVVAVLGVLSGSWKPARMLALPAVTVVPVVGVLGYWAATREMPNLSLFARMSAFSVPSALWGLTVPSAPADLLGRVTWGRRLLVLAGFLFGVVQSVLPGRTYFGTAGVLAPLPLLAAAVAVVAYVGVRRGQVLPLALLVALAPSALGIFVVAVGDALGTGGIMLPFALVVVAGVVVVLRLTRPKASEVGGLSRAAE
ncbi:hypothetical protein GCM10018781_46200 [Kitasatospora indigofera]|uniref:Uncharacterized protein n=1 Tax=Kitasatospora indigofera TaxID=67307 RepID=A0A919G1P6_9ACTN|nr:hypothetical protein [Kitasatospora indigofera]GHH75993.1 hypothetical protein GCM10018781_46200 [Kitasatospora indigofera]